MTFLKQAIAGFALSLCLTACGPAAENSANSSAPDKSGAPELSEAELMTITWEHLMPEGEDELLEELYAEFYEEQEKRFTQQVPLSQIDKADIDILDTIEEGSDQDTMVQIGTYNVVEDLNGAKVRLPGYVVPLDFKASSEYEEFLLVPYFGACLHTPPPPPNQIVFIKSSPAIKIEDIYEPVWIEGVMKTGQFGSDLGNSAYELTLSKLEPYEY